MTDFEKISHLVRFGLSVNKMTTKAVIDWADRKIEEQTDKSLFFDLSLAGTPNKIIEILSENITWNFNDKEIRDLILGYYKEYIGYNPTSWLGIEKELLAYFELLSYDNANDKSDDFLYYLQEDWGLRKDGFGGFVTMPGYLLENLFEYRSYETLKKLLNSQGLIGFEI